MTEISFPRMLQGMSTLVEDVRLSESTAAEVMSFAKEHGSYYGRNGNVKYEIHWTDEDGFKVAWRVAK